MLNIEKLFKAAIDVKRSLEIPFVIKQTRRVLDDEVRAYNNVKDDAEYDLVRLRSELAEAPLNQKDVTSEHPRTKKDVFKAIVAKRIEIREAKFVSEIAEHETDYLFEEQDKDTSESEK